MDEEPLVCSAVVVQKQMTNFSFGKREKEIVTNIGVKDFFFLSCFADHFTPAERHV